MLLSFFATHCKKDIAEASFKVIPPISIASISISLLMFFIFKLLYTCPLLGDNLIEVIVKDGIGLSIKPNVDTETFVAHTLLRNLLHTVGNRVGCMAELITKLEQSLLSTLGSYVPSDGQRSLMKHADNEVSKKLEVKAHLALKHSGLFRVLALGLIQVQEKRSTLLATLKQVSTDDPVLLLLTLRLVDKGQYELGLGCAVTLDDSH